MVFSNIKHITRCIRFTFSSDRGGIVNKRKLAYYSLIGTVLGGVAGLVPIIACLNFFPLVDGLTYGFVTLLPCLSVFVLHILSYLNQQKVWIGSKRNIGY